MKSVLLTRNIEENNETIKEISKYNLDLRYIHCPLIKYETLDFNIDILDNYSNIIITSKYAANILAGHNLKQDIWVVGSKSKRLLGKKVIYTAKNVEDLIKHFPPDLYEQTIYLSSNEITKDLPNKIARHIIYNVEYLNELPLSVINEFKSNIRHLSKPAYREEFKGDTERSTAAYIEVREDASTGSTYKLPLEAKFGKLILLIVAARYTNSFGLVEERICHSPSFLCHSRGSGNPNNEFFIKRYYSNFLKIFLDSRFRGNDIESGNDISLAYFIILILIFLVLYRLPDNLINVMINPFLLHLGYDAFEIASVGKFWGVVGAIIGGLLGGFIMKHKNILNSIFLFGIFHALGHILFIFLEINGKNSLLLFITIGIESITGGMTMTAYIAFISSLCQGKFRATQYSFLSSMMGISRSIFPIISGYMVVNFGWQNFFLFTTIITIPSLLILLKIKTKLQ